MSKHSAIRQYYDSVAAEYANSESASYPLALKQKLIQQLAKPEFRCLDIGVATGLHALPLAQSVDTVFGLDISRKMLEESRKASAENDKHNLFLVQSGGERLPFAGGSFDLVYSFSTIIFIIDPGKAFREAYRVLKQGGFAVLDITGTLNLSQVYWGRYYRNQGHSRLSHFKLREIKAKFEQVGFSVEGFHATGILDQWKYVPLLRAFRFLERITHSRNGKPDLDYRVSQLMAGLANRWYFVLRKAG